MRWTHVHWTDILVRLVLRLARWCSKFFLMTLFNSHDHWHLLAWSGNKWFDDWELRRSEDTSRHNTSDDWPLSIDILSIEDQSISNLSIINYQAYNSTFQLPRLSNTKEQEVFTHWPLFFIWFFFHSEFSNTKKKRGRL